jgi:SAM-dependent methyltransferase
MEAKVQSIYGKFVSSGYYRKNLGGLRGKYDNIRKYWEDEISRFAIRPFLLDTIHACLMRLERLKVVDLGCGSGQGYELLTTIKKDEVGIDAHNHDLLGPDMFGRYVGLDISHEMVEQADLMYRNDEKIRFQQADLNEGLGPAKEFPPFDLYYSAYGSLSHLNDEKLENLLVEIAEHARDGSLIVGDWLGKFSYEWPGNWGLEPEESYKSYTMSWIKDTSMNDEVDSFPIRYWSRQELECVFARASKRTGTAIEPLRFLDRSAFVGRHMDTQQYNPNAQPIRNFANMLHEDNLRTNLEHLIIDYVPVDGFDEQNRYFEKLQVAWNNVVHFLLERLVSKSGKDLLQKYSSADDSVFSILKTLDRIVENVQWIEFGDPRANIIEPQLGYALRSLELQFQEGRGYAHGLIGILKIRKP